MRREITHASTRYSCFDSPRLIVLSDRPMKEMHRARIQKALKSLKLESGSSALVLSSNPHCVRSRDTHYPYRQNSDLFYFTGSHHQELTLVLRPHANDKVILVAPIEDPIKRVWDGSQPSLKALARKLGATEMPSKDPMATVRGLLRGCATAYLQSVANTLSARLRVELASRSAHTLRGLPTRVVEAEHLTARLRAIKDPSEIKKIMAAADLTSAALLHSVQYMRRGVRERELAVLIEYLYRLHGAEPSFNTIVASGKSAATLHYHALGKTLQNGELLLIDTGCELDMYACDVSRTIPIGPIKNPRLQEIYNAVLRAQAAAMRKIRPGVRVSEVHKAAAVELTRALKDLGVLRGSVSQLVAAGAYKPFFPHGIGHSLGIDVHDAAPEVGPGGMVLEKGMVITIEPGLYFNKPLRGIPACGVRIEDDILVTSRGAELLTDGVFPTDLNELAALME